MIESQDWPAIAWAISTCITSCVAIITTATYKLYRKDREIEVMEIQLRQSEQTHNQLMEQEAASNGHFAALQAAKEDE